MSDLDDININWDGEDPDPEPAEGLTPSLYTITQYKEDEGMVGDAEAFAATTLACACGGRLLFLNAKSSGGKSWMLSRIEKLFLGGQWFHIEDETTKADFYRQGEEGGNDAIVHQYPDLVKMEDHVENGLKKAGEGEIADYGHRNPADHDERIVHELYPPETAVWMVARENARFDPEDHPEILNRSLQIDLDASMEQNERVISSQLERVGGAYEYNLDNVQALALRDHIQSIPRGRWETDWDTEDFMVPFWSGMVGNHPIHSLKVKSRRDFARFLKFMNIVTLWNHKDRMVVEWDDTKGDTHRSMLVAPEDLWMAMRVFGETLLMSSLNLGEAEKHILWFLRTTKDQVTASGLVQVLTQAGINVTTSSVQQACKRMTEEGYLTVDDSGTNKYQIAAWATDFEEYKNVDYQAIIDSVKPYLDDMVAGDRLSAEDRDEYVERFARDTRVVHPVTGKETTLTSYTAMKDTLDERQRQVETMLGAYGEEPDKEDVFGAGDTDNAAETGEDGQSGLDIFNQ